jgi:hypothetical protein
MKRFTIEIKKKKKKKVPFPSYDFTVDYSHFIYALFILCQDSPFFLSMSFVYDFLYLL